jgi:preprotein translocase subunit YajC
VKLIPIFAQQAEGGAPAEGQTPAAPAGPFGNPLFVPIIMILFLAVMFIPQMRRQKREAAAKLAAMKPGARVVTTGGIVGRIISMKDGEDEIVIKSDDTKLRILKSAIGSITSDETPASEQKN